LIGSGWFVGTSGGDFREALAPMVRATGNLTGAVTAMRSERTQPDAESLAMGEVRDDADYGGRSGLDNPFTVVHMLGDLTLTAATDHVRAFREVFHESPSGDKVPIYAHLVIARAALEACVVSAWLNEPGIGRDERVKRGLSEFMYSAVEEQRVRYQPGGWARTRDWIEHATKLGWTVTDWEGINGGGTLKGFRGSLA
jgi:hypothetical protein